MATVTFQVANADAADVLAGLEREWRDLAQRLYFGGDLGGYAAATPLQRATACLKASCYAAARSVRLQRAREAVAVADPEIT